MKCPKCEKECGVDPIKEIGGKISFFVSDCCGISIPDVTIDEFNVVKISNPVKETELEDNASACNICHCGEFFTGYVDIEIEDLDQFQFHNHSGEIPTKRQKIFACKKCGNIQLKL